MVFEMEIYCRGGDGEADGYWMIMLIIIIERDHSFVLCIQFVAVNVGIGSSQHLYECEIGLKLNLIVNTNNYTYSSGMECVTHLDLC